MLDIEFLYHSFYCLLPSHSSVLPETSVLQTDEGRCCDIVTACCSSLYLCCNRTDKHSCFKNTCIHSWVPASGRLWRNLSWASKGVT